jgi:hypothetical protein
LHVFVGGTVVGHCLTLRGAGTGRDQSCKQNSSTASAQTFEPKPVHGAGLQEFANVHASLRSCH